MTTDLRREILAAARQELLWQDREGHFFIGSGSSGHRAPDVTSDAVEALNAGLIEKRFASSAVYRLTDAGRAVRAKLGPL